MRFAPIVLKLNSKSSCNKNCIQFLSEKPNTCATPDTRFLRILFYYPRIPYTCIGFSFSFFFLCLFVGRHDTVLSEIAYRRACVMIWIVIYLRRLIVCTPSCSGYRRFGDKLTREQKNYIATQRRGNPPVTFFFFFFFRGVFFTVTKQRKVIVSTAIK